MRVLQACFALLLAAAPARASTWYVHPGGLGDAVTIQDGVDLASAGDTVLVAPATYTDTLHVTIEGEQKVANIHLRVEIVLLAEGDTSNTVISGVESDVAVYVDGVGAGGVIEGFRIQTVYEPFGCVALATRAGPPSWLRIGIWCEGSGVTIRGNAITHNGSAIELRASPVTLEANVIEWAFFGVNCEAGSDAVISANEMHQIAEAITVLESTPTIVDNTIGGKGQMCTGVNCQTGGDAYIAGNRFQYILPTAIRIGSAAPGIENNFFGYGNTAIAMNMVPGVPEIRNNVFYYHLGWVLDISGTSPLIEGNTIDYVPGPEGYAMFLQNGASPIIRNNIITRATQGINCVYGAAPTIECNNVYDVQFPYGNLCSDQTGINGNIAVDPELCGVWDSGNWELQSDSPCAPGNHPDGFNCGRIGAKGVGCGIVPTKRMSLGRVRALFDRGEE